MVGQPRVASGLPIPIAESTARYVVDSCVIVAADSPVQSLERPQLCEWARERVSDQPKVVRLRVDLFRAIRAMLGIRASLSKPCICF